MVKRPETSHEIVETRKPSGLQKVKIPTSIEDGSEGYETFNNTWLRPYIRGMHIVLLLVTGKI